MTRLALVVPLALSRFEAERIAAECSLSVPERAPLRVRVTSSKSAAGRVWEARLLTVRSPRTTQPQDRVDTDPARR